MSHSGRFVNDDRYALSLAEGKTTVLSLHARKDEKCGAIDVSLNLNCTLRANRHN